MDGKVGGGKIEMRSIDGVKARRAIRKDHMSKFAQWFHFRVACEAGQTLELAITGLNNSAYPSGWPNYQACVSEDREYWARTETRFDKEADDGTLTITYTPSGNQIGRASCRERVCQYV